MRVVAEEELVGYMQKDVMVKAQYQVVEEAGRVGMKDLDSGSGRLWKVQRFETFCGSHRIAQAVWEVWKVIGSAVDRSRDFRR